MQWVTHGIKRGKFKMDRRGITYLIAIALGLTVIAGLFLMLVSGTAAQGRHIQQLEARLLELERENEQLEVDIARYGAVSDLIIRARDLEFVPAERVEFLHMTGE
jgi:hypothetical protein